MYVQHTYVCIDVLIIFHHICVYIYLYILWRPWAWTPVPSAANDHGRAGIFIRPSNQDPPEAVHTPVLHILEESCPIPGCF